VRFAGGGDAFYYTFRTLQNHRAELIDDGHNEDIQRTVEVEVGRSMHIVMTYDQGGDGHKPVIASFINGEENGRMETTIELSELLLVDGHIGPFAGSYDELRFYDYALSPEEVFNNFEAGADKLQLASSE
jgi:hypothetical protein